MRRYAQLSATFLSLVAVAHLVRFWKGWPLQIGDLSVPVWGSFGAFVLTGALAVWGFNTARSETP